MSVPDLTREDLEAIWEMARAVASEYGLEPNEREALRKLRAYANANGWTDGKFASRFEER